MKPGVYEMTAAEYHGDPCPEPSLSSTLARTLLERTPGHAWDKARRPYDPLRGDWKFDVKARGDAIHGIILEGKHAFTVLPPEFKDYKTKAAQQLRDEARMAGSVPLLQHQYDSLCATASAIRHRCTQFEDRPIPFTEGKPEQTLIWQEENGVYCRARLDWLRDDRTWVEDLKTTELSASPDSFGGYIWRNGLAIQTAFYLRGVRRVFGTEARFRFIAAEVYGMNATSSLTLDAAGLMLAEEQVERAICTWGDCLERDEWPCYPRRTVEVETPAYHIARWEAEQEGEEL